MSLKRILLPILVTLALPSMAQKEKGKVVNAPKIPQSKNTSTQKKEAKKDEFGFIIEEEPKFRFSNEYESSNVNKTNAKPTTTASKEGIRIEPLRELNSIIHEDTSSIDEGELFIVEIEEQAQFEGSENMVKVASYYSVWDTKSLNPYGTKAANFHDNIPLTLYNEKEGRNWHPMLDKFRLSSHFGWRNKRMHYGTDLALTTGEKIYAPFDGIVRIAGTYNGYGRTVMVRHYNGIETLNGHLSKIIYEPGTLVKAGDVIGLGGNTGRSTGPHLHFETRYEGHQFDSENMFDYSNNEVHLREQQFVISSKLYDYLRGGKSRPTTFKSLDASEEEHLDDLEEEDNVDYQEPVPVKTQQVFHYTVRKGDTLYSIARMAKISVAELAKMNKIPVNKKIYPGLKLRIR